MDFISYIKLKNFTTFVNWIHQSQFKRKYESGSIYFMSQTHGFELTEK